MQFWWREKMIKHVAKVNKWNWVDVEVSRIKASSNRHEMYSCDYQTLIFQTLWNENRFIIASSYLTFVVDQRKIFLRMKHTASWIVLFPSVQIKRNYVTSSQWTINHSFTNSVSFSHMSRYRDEELKRSLNAHWKNRARNDMNIYFFSEAICKLHKLNILICKKLPKPCCVIMQFVSQT